MGTASEEFAPLTSPRLATEGLPYDRQSSSSLIVEETQIGVEQQSYDSTLESPHSDEGEWSTVTHKRRKRFAWAKYDIPLLLKYYWMALQYKAWKKRQAELPELRREREGRVLEEVPERRKIKKDSRSWNHKMRRKLWRRQMKRQCAEILPHGKDGRGNNGRGRGRASRGRGRGNRGRSTSRGPEDPKQARRKRMFTEYFQRFREGDCVNDYVTFTDTIDDLTDGERDLRERWIGRLSAASQEDEDVVLDSDGGESDIDELKEQFDALDAKMKELAPLPQSEEFTSFMTALNDIVAGTFNDKDSDEWISSLESVAILGWQVSRAGSIADVIVALLAFCKARSDQSLMRSIVQQLIDIDKECEPHGLEESINMLSNNWDLVKTNTVFTKISYLMSAAMSMSACNMQKIEWNPFGFKLVCAEAAKEQFKATDVFDALIKTFSWFITTGNRCIADRSLAPIIFSHVAMKGTNEDLSYVLAHADAACSGTEPINEYERKLDTVLEKVCQMKQAAHDSPSIKLWCQNTYSDLVAIKQRVLAKHKNTQIRFAPIGWHIFGPSGVGKSTLQKIVMKTSLNAMGFTTDPRFICNIDVEDAFQSTWTTDCVGASIDDVGHGKAEFSKVSPSNLIIKFFNNMAAQAVKAELNAKGTCFIEFACGVTTSNFKDMNIRQYTDKPEAVLRRFHHLQVGVKPEYRRTGGISLDPAKVPKDGSVLTDVWNITIQECFIYETRAGEESYCFRPLRAVVDGVEKTLKDMDLSDTLRAVINLSKQHKATQDRVVERNKQFDEMSFCAKCSMPSPLCGCEITPHGLSDLKTLCTKLPTKKGKEFSIGKQTYKTTSDAEARVTMKDGVFRLNYSIKYVDTSIKRQYLELMAVDALVKMKKAEIKPHSLEFERVGDLLVRSAVGAVKKSLFSFLGPLMDIEYYLGWTPIRKMATWQLTDELNCALNNSVVPWSLSIIPEWMWTSFLFKRMVHWWAGLTVDRRLRWHYRILYCGILAGGITSLRKRSVPYFVLTAFGGVTLTQAMHVTQCARTKRLKEELVARRQALPELVTKCRDSTPVMYASAAASVILGLKLISWWYRKNYCEEEPQSSETNWFGRMMSKMGLTVTAPEKSKNMVPEHIKEAFKKNNLFWATFTRANGNVTKCNILFPKKGICMFPEHVFYEKGDMTKIPSKHITVDVSRFDGPGGFFQFKVDKTNMVLVPDKDLVVASVPNCPDLKNRIDKFALGDPVGSSRCTWMYRFEDEFETEDVTIAFGRESHKYKSFYGGRYTTLNARDGTCMGLIVSQTKQPCILGVHIGGATGTLGVMQSVNQLHITSAIKALENDGVFVHADATILPNSQYGKTLVESERPHPSCMAAKVGSEAYFEVLGSTHLRASHKSTVKESCISDTVADVCGVKNSWGEPQMRPNWKAYNATMEHLAHPALMFEPSEVKKACDDYLEPLLECVPDLEPLTFEQSILGIPGKKGVEALPMKTSMGFPVFGPKEPHFEEVREGEVLKQRIPSQAIRDEYDRLSACYEKGERGYPVCAASLKDEPTPVDKDKVRVFYGCPVAFSMLIRKYFLPITAFLQENSTLSECAVGCNPFSHDWESLMGHAKKYGVKCLVGWDYSKYDIRMNSQITVAVFEMLLKLAQRAGYSEKDLSIMRGIVTDIVHPLIDYNGTMIMLYNINTSGNNITVFVNSLAGSIYVRLGFFAHYPNGNFRTCVAALTYGDDFIGSVKDGCSNFNFLSFQRFLEQVDMKITPPDKKAKGTKFLKEEEADFLKRKSVLVEGLPCVTGALCESSIFKSLHSNLKSKTLTDEELTISCIETAMHEWFFHGREKFETRQKQMQEICKRHNFVIPSVCRTFDERVEFWKETYGH